MFSLTAEEPVLKDDPFEQKYNLKQAVSHAHSSGVSIQVSLYMYCVSDSILQRTHAS